MLPASVTQHAHSDILSPVVEVVVNSLQQAQATAALSKLAGHKVGRIEINHPRGCCCTIDMMQGDFGKVANYFG